MRKAEPAPGWRTLALATLGALAVACPAPAQWPQWGGQNRNFTVKTSGLARKWPSSGPTKLWSRELGPGYSAVLADGGRLYTMFRAGDQEVVVCLNAETGRTLWEYGYTSLPPEGHLLPERYPPACGNGPNATPLLAGGRLYAIGVAGVMHCLNADTGKPLWTRNLLTEFDGTFLEFGYSSSPIAYKDTIIALVGGSGHSIVAFDQADGHVAWKNLDFKNTFSSPLILRIAGEEQLVTCMATEVIGADPTNGRLNWRYPIRNQWKQNIAQPVPAGDDMLWVSTYPTGSRGLKLRKNASGFEVEEVWSSRKVQVFFGTAVAIGDHVYTSTGGSGAVFIAAMNMKTGETAWRKRGFNTANLLYADGLLIILDEDGDLALATASPSDFTVLSRFKLLEAPAWTVPTLVGRTLYVRDCRHIMALDLSAATRTEGK